MSSFFTKYKKFAATLLVVTMLGGFVYVPQAHALTVAANVISDVSATNIKTSIESTVSAAAETVQAGLMTALHIKELTLDGIAYGLMKTILKGITRSILNWINSGFQGSPAFVTDLDGFLLDLADQTAGDFIYGTELGFLCSPFELDVRLALNIQHQASRDYQPLCTLSDVSDNIEGFLAGDFSQGGWPAWFELTQGSNNDPGKAYFSADAELGARILTAEGREIELLNANDFFLNIEVCDVANHSEGNKEKCTTATPGKIISDQLTFELQSGEIALIEADEINEIVGALFAQLAQQAITGTYGLLGLGGTSYAGYDSSYGSSGNLSYFDAIDEEDFGLIEERGDVADIALAIQGEAEFKATQQDIIDTLEDAERRYLTILDEFTATTPSGGLRIMCFNTNEVSLPDSFAEQYNQAQDDIAISEEIVLYLDDLQDQILTATSTQGQKDLLDEFQDFRAAGLIHNEIDAAVSEGELLRLEYDIESFFEDEVLPERNRCRRQLNL